MTGLFGFFEKTVYYQKVEHLNDGYCNFVDTGHSRFAYKKEDIRKNDLLSKSQEFKSISFFKKLNIEKVFFYLL